jgi:hypothetical protein
MTSQTTCAKERKRDEGDGSTHSNSRASYTAARIADAGRFVRYHRLN